HPSGNQRLKPGEVIQPHPLYPHLDTKGRVLPGFSLQEGDSYTAKQEGRPFPVKAQELRRALYESARSEDVALVYEALFRLTQPGEHGYKVQLAAIGLFLDRFFGRPAAQVHVSKEQVSAAVKLDLSDLTTEELQQYMQLQTKVLKTEDNAPN
ncbi:MAG TPA: hypothetical protein VJ873_10145, partial [bacterium]|nr:hypothetical protein [bacterium]